MRSDWFNGIEILQGRWQHEEKVGYSYSSGLEKTLFKWDIYVPLVTKGLIKLFPFATDFSKHHYKFAWQFLHWNSSCSMLTYGLSVGHTDMTKLIVTFHKFTNASKNVNDKFKAVLLPTRI